MHGRSGQGLGDQSLLLPVAHPLAKGVGLDPEYVRLGTGILPATRFAVDAYDKDRIAGLLKNYDFANEETISYFQHRLDEAPRDVAFGLEWVLDHAITKAEQEQAADALMFKTDVLWAQLDALHSAYVDPGRIPPGAWQPDVGLA